MHEWMLTLHHGYFLNCYRGYVYVNHPTKHKKLGKLSVSPLHEKLFNGSRTIMVFLVNLHMTYNQLLLTFFW